MAPLITYDKDMVVKLGEELGVPWEYTYSCYAGYGFTTVGGKKLPVHCGACSNDKRRALAFKVAGIYDPSLYARPPIADVQYEQSRRSLRSRSERVRKSWQNPSRRVKQTAALKKCWQREDYRNRLPNTSVRLPKKED